MKKMAGLAGWLAVAALLVTTSGRVTGLQAATGRTLAGVACETPPPLHCGGDQCAGELLRNQGNATEPVSGRKFFLDYPCDLKPNDPVVFILSLHGAGSIGNWQRHYFPAMDYKEKYRLVIATPTAANSQSITTGAPPARMWTAAADDAYLQNLVTYVLGEVGRKNVKSFWLAGHSQGGMTSNRLVCTDFFKDKVDGWLSLSGGRIGPAAIAPDFFGPSGPPAALSGGSPGAPRPGAASPPSCDFSYIFTSGEKEITALPETSPWAEKYSCGRRVRRADIVDTVKGYVTGAAPGRGASWGREARPGTSEVFLYTNCKSGKVVADVLRMDKGHTEGLEPKVTEALVAMMASAQGGKVRAGGDKAVAAALACDRECLRGFITRYLDAMVAHTPAALALAPNARFTEDTVDMKLGDGLWKGASKIRPYRLDILDVAQGVAASQVVVEEAGSPVMLALRLKIANRAIAEIETQVTRNLKEGAIFAIDALKSTNAAMTAPVDPGKRASRSEAIRLAEFYPAGLEIGSFVAVDAPFAPDAYRFENGRLMAGKGCTFQPPSCEDIKGAAISKHDGLSYRVLAVDEELGITLLRINFGRADRYGEGNGLMVWEAFKVFGGQIHAVEAFMKIMPAASGSGWDTDVRRPVVHAAPQAATGAPSKPNAATYITDEEVKAVNATPGVDRTIRVVDIGNENFAVGIIHRVAPAAGARGAGAQAGAAGAGNAGGGRANAPAAAPCGEQAATPPAGAVPGGISHDSQTEGYLIVSGGGTLITGGRIVNGTRSAPESAVTRELNGPSCSGLIAGDDVVKRAVKTGDIIIIPAGVPHGWTGITDHVDYLSFRPSEHVLQAGYVHPSIKK